MNTIAPLMSEVTSAPARGLIAAITGSQPMVLTSSEDYVPTGVIPIVSPPPAPEPVQHNRTGIPKSHRPAAQLLPALLPSSRSASFRGVIGALQPRLRSSAPASVLRCLNRSKPLRYRCSSQQPNTPDTPRTESALQSQTVCSFHRFFVYCSAS